MPFAIAIAIYAADATTFETEHVVGGFGEATHVILLADAHSRVTLFCLAFAPSAEDCIIGSDG